MTFSNICCNWTGAFLYFLEIHVLFSDQAPMRDHSIGEFKRMDHLGQQTHEQTHTAQLCPRCCACLWICSRMFYVNRKERDVSNARWWISVHEKDLMKKLSKHEVNVLAIYIFSNPIKGGHQKPHPVPPESRLWWLWRYRERDQKAEKESLCELSSFTL